MIIVIIFPLSLMWHLSAFLLSEREIKPVFDRDIWKFLKEKYGKLKELIHLQSILTRFTVLHIQHHHHL